MGTSTFISFVILKGTAFCSSLPIFCSSLQHFGWSLLEWDFFAIVELSLLWKNIQFQKEIPKPKPKSCTKWNYICQNGSIKVTEIPPFHAIQICHPDVCFLTLVYEIN